MKKKMIALLLAITTCSIGIAGCGKTTTEADETSQEEAQITAEVSVDTEEPTEETEVEDVAPEGMARNNLTGEWIDEELASKRPFACMIENTAESLPHYGIGSADILYEAPVEGTITRYMALFSDYDELERIGNSRSCRTYYVMFASEYDAIYAHFGESIFAMDILETIDDLDGLNGAVENIMYYRTSDMNAPHNAYMDGTKVDEAIEYMGYDTQLADGFGEHFDFAGDTEEVTLDDGYDAVVIQPGYRIDNPWFVYDEEEGVYDRFSFKKEEVDATTGEQLSFKNVILQYVDYTMYNSGGVYKEYDNKYLNIDTLSGGKAIYFTNGKAIDTTWKKDSQTSRTIYYDENGEEIKVNQGKTMICIVLNENADDVNIYASEDEFTAPN
jgi:hypothetical protein